MAAQITIGDVVRVELPEVVNKKYEMTTDEKIFSIIGKYDGQEFVVSRKVNIRVGTRLKGIYYELKGAESDRRIPYGFLAEWLRLR